MPIIDLQRRLVRTGAIRLGNKVVKKNADGTPALDRSGRPIMFPNKLDTFRVTSPHRDVAVAVADKFGGELLPWRGPKGPEWEVITTRSELEVLVPNQIIDTNYEFWGNKIKVRLCDGQLEKLRGEPCLCKRWDNHDHKYSRGRCLICKLDQKWSGEPHVHEFDMGECVVCGCSRACKPTTRVSVMIQGIPGIGVFKVESHGINAAMELPTLADIVRTAPMPLPGLLGMRFEEQSRLKKDGEIEVRKFYVPELRFPWAIPETLFATGQQLERAARDSITITPTLAALEAAKPGEVDADSTVPVSREDVLRLALSARKVSEVRALWKGASCSGLIDKALERALSDRARELKILEDHANGEVIEAEIIED